MCCPYKSRSYQPKISQYNFDNLKFLRSYLLHKLIADCIESGTHYVHSVSLFHRFIVNKLLYCSTSILFNLQSCTIQIIHDKFQLFNSLIPPPPSPHHSHYFPCFLMQ